MKVGIHQPNFFPWIGFFDRILMSDRFIFFDHVQKPRGKSWLSRVQVSNNGKPIWLSIPIIRKSRGLEKIYDAQINGDPEALFLEIHRKLKAYYRQAPYGSEMLHLLEDLYVPEAFLSDLNINFIVGISKAFGFKTKFLRSSERFRDNVPLFKSDMILETCLRFDVTSFICGGYAANNLINYESFQVNNIDVLQQEFRHPKYPQHQKESFVEGLSILDLISNVGIEAGGEIIKKNREKINNLY